MMTGGRFTVVPVNGPAIAASGSLAAVAWFTAAQGEPRVLLALSYDGGYTFQAPFRVDMHRPIGRSGVAISSDGRIFASWIENSDKGAGLYVREMTQKGATVNVVRIADVSDSRNSGFPQIAATSEYVYVAWTGTAPQVHLARAAL